MPLVICYYEDEKFDRFYPVTIFRPVYTLRAGIVPLFRRGERYFPDAKVCLSARDQVSPLLAETLRDHPVNIIKRGDCDILFINGRIRDYGDLVKAVSEARLSTVFTRQGETVAVLFKKHLLEEIPPLATQREYQQLYETEHDHFAPAPTEATLYDYCWEIMADIEREITADFAHLRPGMKPRDDVILHDGAIVVNRDDVYFDSGVEVKPGAVIDASSGPVYIGCNSRIEAHAAVIGPCYIGPNSVVLAGRIAASSIGHTCRVGGEVEESIFHCYVNKYHAGFIGHSYVAPWVNFGAMTTNSDLKNNYSNIRVSINESTVDTESIKVGSFIGDHTKFGIGTLLNTGINIGVCCNIFGGTLIVDKEVPSFRWGNSENYEQYHFDKAIETARRSVARRNCSLSKHEIDLLRAVADSAMSKKGAMEFRQAVTSS